MSRIRSIHPGIWTDVEFVGLSPFARLLFIGIWNECDDKGIFLWSPMHLKMRILPADNVDASALLDEIEVAGRVRRYEVDGKWYGAVKNFAKFQRPKKPNDIHPASPETLVFAGHSSEAKPDEDVAGANQFPTSGEKSPQMEEGGGNRSSEANASVAAPSAVDLTKAVFDIGIKILMATGLPEKRARSMLGKWRSEYGDGPTIAILSRAEIVRPEVPIEWITQGLKAERNRTNGQSAERFPQPTTLDAINRAIELTGGAEGRDAPRPASSDWGAGRLPDPMLALGYVER